MYAFYEGRTFPRSDEVFPTFILEQMPHGLVGLIVAAIVAATMSTHSGAINSLAAATTHDIYLPLTGRAADDPRTLRFGKRAALVWGVGLTLGALLFKQQGTPVVKWRWGSPRSPMVPCWGAFSSACSGPEHGSATRSSAWPSEFW